MRPPAGPLLPRRQRKDDLAEDLHGDQAQKVEGFQRMKQGTLSTEVRRSSSKQSDVRLIKKGLFHFFLNDFMFHTI
jgi:hypothetical protein